MLPFVISFAISFVLTLLIVRSSRVHGSHSADDDFSLPQKIHAEPVPRIGGLSVVLALATCAPLFHRLRGAEASAFFMQLMLCAAPSFAVGLFHDLTDSVAPRGRLLATAAAAMLAWFWIGARVYSTDIPGIDALIAIPAGSLVVSIFAVAGIANAVNIIDGLNGLASMCVILMLAALAYVGFQVDDVLIGSIALAGIGAVFGFFLWNYPSGLVFLGDGGAYFLGFLVAELCILLLARNPGEVSPLFPLLLCIYPVFETVFSIYRRAVLRSQPASMPDGIHLHSLLYKRILRWVVGDRSAKARAQRNSRTSPLLWALCMLSVLPAALFFESTPIVSLFLLLFISSYVALYWRIVRFRSPRWLRTLVTRPLGSPEADNPPQ